jgi:2OG-Fe(II) oxygenase superfamily
MGLDLQAQTISLARSMFLVLALHSNDDIFQLVRYKPGEFFGVHHDLGDLQEDGNVALPPRDTSFGSKRRLVTLFCYLNTLPQDSSDDDVENSGATTNGHGNDKKNQGSSSGSSSTSRNGATQFPAATNSNINSNNEKTTAILRHARNTRSQARLVREQKQNPKEEEQQQGLLIQPVQGRAVLFCNITPGGLPDARTIHAGLPPIAVVPPALGGDGIAKKKKKGGKKNHGSDQHHFAVNKYGLNIWMCED